MNIKERIRKAGPTTRTVPVWLGADLDLLDEHDAAVTALEDAQKPADSLAGRGPTGELQQRVDELRARLDEFRVDFRVRGLDDLHHARLLEEHPPRKDEDGEILTADDRGWNRQTFPSAMARAATVSVDGEQLDDEDWLLLLGGVRRREDGTEEEVLGILTSIQIDELAAAAYALTRHPVDVPFSSAASKTTRSSGHA